MFSSVKLLYRNRSSNVCADTLAEDYPICVLMVCFLMFVLVFLVSNKKHRLFVIVTFYNEFIKSTM